MADERTTEKDAAPADATENRATPAFSENVYREIVESSSDLIWQCDNAGRYIFLNKAWERAFGYRIEEMLGRPFTDFMSPEQARKDTAAFRRLTTGGSVRDYETRHRHKDGRPVWLSFNASYVRDAGGEIVGTRGIAYDISERKRAEVELAESRQRYREMVMRSPLAMHFYDLEGDRLLFSDFNPAADRMLGVENRQFVGKTVEEAFPPLRDTEVPERYRAAAADGIPWQTEQIAYEDERISGAYEVNAFQISKNKMVAVFQDITDRKRAEIALKNEKERIAVTLAGIADGVIATDVAGRITLMNKSAEELTGACAERSIGRELREIFKIVDETERRPLSNPVERVLKKGAAVTAENHTILIATDGTERHIADSGAPLLDGNGKLVGGVLVFRDVTEKIRIAERVQRTQKLESLGILAGGIAHDFNNLLGGIFGYIDLARTMTQERNVSEYLEKVFFTMDRARGLTDQLLTFSKGGEPVLRVMDPRPVVERSAKFALSGTHTALSCRFAESLHSCRIDENRIAQVIDNIVINAKQAMPEGGTVSVVGENMTIDGEGEGSLRPGDYVRIEISDTGPGIPPEILPKIFDPFFSTKHQGSGLGLAVCHSIVQKHGGTIEATSPPGRGAVFTICLPAVGLPERPRTAAAAVRSSVNPVGRVLVMDDEDYIRDVLVQILRVAGFFADTAACGEEAIAALQAESPEDPYLAAILDLTVPGKMGGREAAAQMKAIRPDLPIFLSSGYSDDPVIADPAAFGFSGSITKPYRLQDVENALRQVIQK